MTRPRLFVVAALGAAFALQAPPASAHRFGDAPLQDVKDGAAAATRCSGLTASELAAMVLAPTWPEVAPGSDLTPSPMALGRWDTSPALYSPWANTPRASWHAGVGAWQIDTLNLDMAVFEKIRTNTAARFVAR